MASEPTCTEIEQDPHFVQRDTRAEFRPTCEMVVTKPLPFPALRSPVTALQPPHWVRAEGHLVAETTVRGILRLWQDGAGDGRLARFVLGDFR
jgi:hypothetical protein